MEVPTLFPEECAWLATFAKLKPNAEHGSWQEYFQELSPDQMQCIRDEKYEPTPEEQAQIREWQKDPLLERFRTASLEEL